MSHPLAKPPPSIDGLAASSLQLPPGNWPTVLDCLCAQFSAIAREDWLQRMQRGRVLDAEGQALNAASRHRAGLTIYYYREVAAETLIPFRESILHSDEHLVVADKPHFLPVAPTGRFVRETLLTRLIKSLNNPDLVPLHRIDRGTAGLVLFSANPATRARYQALFRTREMGKCYHALAPALPGLQFPLLRATRLEAGEPFFLMQEVPGAANTETRIEVIAQRAESWLYALQPVTGKKHQLRVHMSALGAPIVNDDFYPLLDERAEDDYSRPLKLLAHSLQFIDPISGASRRFQTAFEL